MIKKKFIPTHLFSANAVTKPYAPVMVLRKFDDSSVYEVMLNTFYAGECQLKRL